MPPSELSCAVSAANSSIGWPSVVVVYQAQSWTSVSRWSASRASRTAASSEADSTSAPSVSWLRRFVGSVAATGPTPTVRSVASATAASRARDASSRTAERDPAWRTAVMDSSARGDRRSACAVHSRANRPRPRGARAVPWGDHLPPPRRAPARPPWRTRPWPSARPTPSTSSSSAPAPAATPPPSAPPSWACAWRSSTRTRSAGPASTAAASRRRRSSSRPTSTTASRPRAGSSACWWPATWPSTTRPWRRGGTRSCGGCGPA